MRQSGRLELLINAKKKMKKNTENVLSRYHWILYANEPLSGEHKKKKKKKRFKIINT